MFRTIWTKTLRDYRFAIFGWGIGIGLLLFASLVAYATQVDTPAARASLPQIAAQFRFFGDPVEVTTPTGYTTWRVMGLFAPILISIWAVLAGARLVRGEEERGSIDVLLSTPVSRLHLLLEKLGALLVAMLFIGLLIGLLAMAGYASAKLDVDVAGSLLTGLNVSLIGFFFAALALFLSQLLTSRSTAAGLAGALLAVALILDATGRTVDNTAWLQHLSPLYYYNASKPLIADYTSTHGANPGAMLLLLGLAVLLIAVSTPLFLRRDIGETALPSWQRYASGVQKDRTGQALKQAEKDVFIRAISLRALRAHAESIFWWLVGIGFYAIWATSIAKTTEGPLHKLYASVPLINKLFSGQDIATNAGFLALIVFLFLPILVVVFALVEALPWANDLENGRFELLLSTPKPRTRLILERFGAVLIAMLLAPLVIWLGILIAASATAFSVDASKVAAASFGLLPLELIIASLVYLLAGRLRPATVVGVMTAFLAASYFVELLHTLLNVPDWVVSLSIFHQYGSPITDGLNWGAFFAMIGIALVLLALGVVLFNRGDVERAA